MTWQLISFLKALEQVIPPAPGCHHAITYARYGSDEAGWEDKLALQVGDYNPTTKETVFQCFFLDDEDLYKPAMELVIDIVKEFTKPQADAQLSGTPTRYRPHE